MEITIYTTPNCVQCNQTKKMLAAEGIAFNTVDLSQDEVAMDYVKSLGFTSAPVVKAGVSVWGGFRYERLKGLIDQVKSEEAHKSA